MRYLFIVFLALGSIGCTSNKKTTFSYSGVFAIKFPQELMLESTVMITDGLALKTKHGNYIVGQILTAGTDGLPLDFDMRKYPELVLGIKEYTGLSQEFRDKLSNSVQIFNGAYDLSHVDIARIKGTTRYSTCRDKSCLGLVVKDSFPEHILLVISEGRDKAMFDEIFKGSIYVN